jgi:hypothetical protein
MKIVQAFKSLTRPDLLKEVAEYIRLRAIQFWLPAHSTFKVNKARREYVRAQEEARKLIAREIENSTV